MTGPIYLIERDHRDGAYIVETSLGQADRAATIAAVRSEPKDVNRVLRLNPDGTWTDATREIAQAVMDGLDEPPRDGVRDLLENVFGCRAVADLCREMENA